MILVKVPEQEHGVLWGGKNRTCFRDIEPRARSNILCAPVSSMIVCFEQEHTNVLHYARCSSGRSAIATQIPAKAEPLFRFPPESQIAAEIADSKWEDWGPPIG